MIKVNSLSGGKTSSFMAEKYPADFNVFALVTIEAEYCKPKDKSLINYIKIGCGYNLINIFIPACLSSSMVERSPRKRKVKGSNPF